MLSPRIEERRKAIGISQAELARRAQVLQTTMNGIIRGGQRTTPHLIKIAQAFGTSPAYLMGATDDPDTDAMPSSPASRYQAVTMQVLLPSEAALARMFQGLIASMLDVSGDELARELAMLLPTRLEQLRGRLREVASFEDEPRLEDPAASTSADRAPRRARHT